MRAKTPLRALACAVIVAGLAVAVGAPASAATQDTQPPTAPIDVRVTAVTQTSVTLAWGLTAAAPPR
jgi:hypothetical protein